MFTVSQNPRIIKANLKTLEQISVYNRQLTALIETVKADELPDTASDRYKRIRKEQLEQLTDTKAALEFFCTLETTAKAIGQMAERLRKALQPYKQVANL